MNMPKPRWSLLLALSALFLFQPVLSQAQTALVGKQVTQLETDINTLYKSKLIDDWWIDARLSRKYTAIETMVFIPVSADEQSVQRVVDIMKKYASANLSFKTSTAVYKHIDYTGTEQGGDGIDQFGQISSDIAVAVPGGKFMTFGTTLRVCLDPHTSKIAAADTKEAVVAVLNQYYSNLQESDQ